jgi:hypothetical protein
VKKFRQGGIGGPGQRERLFPPSIDFFHTFPFPKEKKGEISRQTIKKLSSL